MGWGVSLPGGNLCRRRGQDIRRFVRALPAAPCRSATGRLRPRPRPPDGRAPRAAAGATCRPAAGRRLRAHRPRLPPQPAPRRAGPPPRRRSRHAGRPGPALPGVRRLEPGRACRTRSSEGTRPGPRLWRRPARPLAPASRRGVLAVDDSPGAVRTASERGLERCVVTRLDDLAVSRARFDAVTLLRTRFGARDCPVGMRSTLSDLYAVTAADGGQCSTSRTPAGSSTRSRSTAGTATTTAGASTADRARGRRVTPAAGTASRTATGPVAGLDWRRSRRHSSASSSPARAGASANCSATAGSRATRSSWRSSHAGGPRSLGGGQSSGSNSSAAELMQ